MPWLIAVVLAAIGGGVAWYEVRKAANAPAGTASTVTPGPITPAPVTPGQVANAASGSPLGTGPTSDVSLYNAAMAVNAALLTGGGINYCASSNPSVLAFQQAWNVSTDAATTARTLLGATGILGSTTQACLQAALGPQYTTPNVCPGSSA